MVILEKLDEVVTIVAFFSFPTHRLLYSNEDSAGLITQNSATEVLKLLTLDLLWHVVQI